MSWKLSKRFVGRSNTAYTLIDPLYPRFGSAKPHIWNAKTSAGNQVVLKFRRMDTPDSQLDFQKEISQGHRFKGARYIRQLLDVVEDPAEKNMDCGMVLDRFPETLGI